MIDWNVAQRACAAAILAKWLSANPDSSKPIRLDVYGRIYDVLSQHIKYLKQHEYIILTGRVNGGPQLIRREDGSWAVGEFHSLRS